MANKFKNLLANTKTRTMVLLVLGVLTFGIAIALSQTGSSTASGNPATQMVSKTTSVPNQVKSTPGGDVTRKYQELQEQANARGAKEAAKKGTTFIPTLTGSAQGYNDADFQKQLSSAYSGMDTKCSKEAVADLRKQGMDTTTIIMHLKSDGCSAAAIAALFSSDEIAAALLAENCTAGNLKGCGADTVKALKATGLDSSKIAATMKQNGCKTSDIVKALKDSGASNTEIVKALKDNGVTTSDIVKALKDNGASFDDIAKALKDNGTSIDDITTALKANGADASQIANALLKAGFNKADILPALTKAGFSALDIAKAMSSLDIGGPNSATLLSQQAAADAAAQRLSAQQEAQQLAAYSQQRQGKIQELMTAMDAEKKQAMDTWTQVPTQTLVSGKWAAKRDKDSESSESGSSSGSSKSGSKSKSGGSEENAKIILKAGSILFAVLDTAVNSDEPGPVLATIVSGSLKGSKLMGTINTNLDSETMGINFTAINMPDEKKSMGINAVAIDPDTARSALASDVDHHYLYRWGSLFASSFVQGYATAVASSGTTSTTNQGAAGTTTTTSTPGQTGRQSLFAGLSAIGSKWSDVVSKNFQRPITITIDQGTGIGVLIYSDLTYGSDPVFYSGPSTTTAAAGAAGGAAAGAAGGTAAGGGLPQLSNDQRQAVLNLLQNQPTQASVPQQAAPGSTVTTVSGGGTK